MSVSSRWKTIVIIAQDYIQDVTTLSSRYPENYRGDLRSTWCSRSRGERISGVRISTSSLSPPVEIAIRCQVYFVHPELDPVALQLTSPIIPSRIVAERADSINLTNVRVYNSPWGNRTLTRASCHISQPIHALVLRRDAPPRPIVSSARFRAIQIFRRPPYVIFKWPFTSRRVISPRR